MSQSIFDEINLFLRFLQFGFGVGMSYSLLLLLRRFLLRGRIHEMIQDCLFGPIWSLLYFYRSYQYNCGITRWYMVAGVILGCICWYETGKHMEAILRKLRNKRDNSSA
ncbi:MAG: spore cortex biosynthesis protein YabQ [Lachnospiraceae bacterium]|nr:spore cortex biosynthesis protein YabQ [Clostridiales bacterium]MDY3110007.1 spore cortex biosynthesis protein YabQ [Lachnospiraceae bacterium]